jgi:hypothetical protein
VITDKEIKREVRRAQNQMAATIMGLKPPGRLAGYQTAPDGSDVPVFRKVWRDNNKYDARGNRR